MLPYQGKKPGDILCPGEGGDWLSVPVSQLLYPGWWSPNTAIRISSRRKSKGVLSGDDPPSPTHKHSSQVRADEEFFDTVLLLLWVNLSLMPRCPELSQQYDFIWNSRNLVESNVRLICFANITFLCLMSYCFWAMWLPSSLLFLREPTQRIYFFLSLHLLEL